MSGEDPGPLLVVTVLMDHSARAAAVTRSHGDAMVRAMVAAEGCQIAGLELVELPIAQRPFAALRRALGMPPTTVALYDVFPLSAALPAELRTIAGQFLAAEALWAMEEQGALDGAPAGEQLTLPKGWSRNPKDIRERLVSAGATSLSEQAVATFQQVKARWDAHAPQG